MANIINDNITTFYSLLFTCQGLAIHFHSISQGSLTIVARNSSSLVNKEYPENQNYITIEDMEAKIYITREDIEIRHYIIMDDLEDVNLALNKITIATCEGQVLDVSNVQWIQTYLTNGNFIINNFHLGNHPTCDLYLDSVIINDGYVLNMDGVGDKVNENMTYFEDHQLEDIIDQKAAEVSLGSIADNAVKAALED